MLIILSSQCKWRKLSSLWISIIQTHLSTEFYQQPSHQQCHHDHAPCSLPPVSPGRGGRPVLVSRLAARALAQGPRPHLAHVRLQPGLPRRASLQSARRPTRRSPERSKVHIRRRLRRRWRAHAAHRAPHERTTAICRLGECEVCAYGSMARHQGLEGDREQE